MLPICGNYLPGARRKEAEQTTDSQTHPVVAIAGIIGGIYLATVVMIAVLASDQLSIAAWIVTALAFMGIGLGYFAAKSPKP